MDTRAVGLTIGKVARSAGLAIDTVRYYEREGLLEKPGRTASDYRHYTTDAIMSVGRRVSNPPQHAAA